MSVQRIFNSLGHYFGGKQTILVMPGLDSYLFCLALNSTLRKTIEIPFLLTTSIFKCDLVLWEAGRGHIHSPPSFLLWCKPEMPEDPLELTCPEKSLEESSLGTTRMKEKKKKNHLIIEN